MGQTHLSSETLGKFTSESTLSPEMKSAKTMRGSVMIAKSKAESHGSGSQKQHHQHASETPQVQTRAPQKRGGIPPPALSPQNPSAMSDHAIAVGALTRFMVQVLQGEVIWQAFSK